MGEITLVTGGARSGKSSFALHLAQQAGCAKRVFIATAVALDSEMAERIAKHQAERGAQFHNAEAPYDLAGAIGGIAPSSVAVVDCLTVYLGNLFHKHDSQEFFINQETELCLNSLLQFKAQNPAQLILVTNEVGWGIVPGDSTTRLFRDMAGRFNSRVAGLSNSVYLCACGIPLKLK